MDKKEFIKKDIQENTKIIKKNNKFFGKKMIKYKQYLFDNSEDFVKFLINKFINDLDEVDIQRFKIFILSYFRCGNKLIDGLIDMISQKITRLMICKKTGHLKYYLFNYLYNFEIHIKFRYHKRSFCMKTNSKNFYLKNLNFYRKKKFIKNMTHLIPEIIDTKKNIKKQEERGEIEKL